MANKSPAKRKPFYEQNDRFLPIDPPNYLGTVARSVWTKIIPFLKATEKVERIDTFLVETYCTIQSPGSGEILGEQSMGFKKNPAVATMKDAAETLNKIGIQLGLTPKGRAELAEIAGSQADNTSMKDKMAAFFK